MGLSKNVKDNDRAAYINSNSVDGGTDRRVRDLEGNEILEQIKDNTGGTTPTAVTILNVAAPVANTEVSQALPANTKGFLIRSRNKGTIKLAFTSGQSGTNYVTIPAGSSYEENNFYTSLTIYFQSSKTGDTLELIAYV